MPIKSPGVNEDAGELTHTGCRGTRNVEYDLAASVEPLRRTSAETASVLDGPALVVEPLGPSQQLAIASVRGVDTQ